MASSCPSFQSTTEEFVSGVCRQTFLSLWSYPNPQNAAGKELCDFLVVCDPDVIVVSVRDVRLNLEAMPDVAAKRWLKKAVRGSVQQLYGAVRGLESCGDRVIRHDGTLGVQLPARPLRKIHRISVSLGSKGLVPLPAGDFGKGFVHVLDERAFILIMENLDTIADFVDYLGAKEALAVVRPGLLVDRNT